MLIERHESFSYCLERPFLFKFGFEPSFQTRITRGLL